MVAVVLPYREQAVLLGPRQSLLTFVTRPSAPPQLVPTAVVILNTGIVHRIGHHRMYVTLSRILAAQGRTVVRFDFSGIGDSEPRSDLASPLVACLDDIRVVLDWLEATYRISRVVLVGLCSGADHAVLYGHTDRRVTGLVLMDPTMPPTARYYYHYVAQRFLRLQNWLSVITLRSGVLRLVMAQIRHRVSPGKDLEGLTLQNLQFSPYLRECYQRTAAQGKKILAAFTSISARQTYDQQILDAFPEAAQGGGLRLEFFPESDHLFSRGDQRARLNGVIVDWLGES
jgi:pimeloyl-ACP methyl ester carboxylesterase